jgi:hypothetical protein
MLNSFEAEVKIPASIQVKRPHFSAAKPGEIYQLKFTIRHIIKRGGGMQCAGGARQSTNIWGPTRNFIDLSTPAAHYSGGRAAKSSSSQRRQQVGLPRFCLLAGGCMLIYQRRSKSRL